MIRLIVFLALIFQGYSELAAKTAPLPENPAGELLVLEGGRYKPLDSFAWESIRSIYGKSHYKDADGDKWEPRDLVMSMAAEPMKWADTAMLRVDYLELKQELGLTEHHKFFSYNELSKAEGLQELVQKAREVSGRPEESTKLTRETEMLYGRLSLLDNLLSGYGFHLVPNGERWVSPMEAPQDIKTGWVDMLVAWRTGDEAAFRSHVAAFEAMQADVENIPASGTIRNELAYNSIQPFHKALQVYLLLILVGILAVVWSKPPVLWLGRLLLAASFLFHTAGLYYITVITGRAPVSNLFESMVFIAWTMIFFTGLFYIFNRKEQYLLIIAGVLGGLSMFYALDSTIDISINPLVPVLRSYWLNIHVTIITASYGAFALAAGLGHVYLFRYRKAPRDTAYLNKVDLLGLRSLQIGVLLLTAGVILGAVWANESWGRYWGWDPKETWSLITLLLYLAVIHGRLNGWATRLTTAVCNVAGFAAVLMTYFGVNYYLSGLHSYATGNPDPVPLKLIVYLLAETAFVVWCFRAGKRRLELA